MAASKPIFMDRMGAGRRGFTLLELLIVIAIIALLAGMLMPMVGVIRQSTLRSRTEFVMRKTEAGLRLFKAEWGGYPYQQTYPAAVSAGEPFPNRLYYRIGSDISAADRGRVMVDMEAASAAFAYSCAVTQGDRSAQFAECAAPSAHAFRNANCVTAFTALFITATGSDAGAPDFALPAMLNQAAQEQARLAMVIGATGMRGPIVCTSAMAVGFNRSAQPLLASYASAGNPGFAADYLKGEIPAGQLRGEDILDGWRRPLVYICQAVPGMQGQGGATWNRKVPSYDSRYLGLGAIGFDLATGPGQALITGGRPLLAYGGRVRLSRGDAGDGLGPTPADATWFPDATDLRGSDVRYYAAPGFETEFELWSAGRDGAFSYRRSDPANRDNVSVIDYNRGL